MAKSNPFEGMSKTEGKSDGAWLARGSSISQITNFEFREGQRDAAWIVKVEGTIYANTVVYRHAATPQKDTNAEGTSFLVLYQLQGDPKKDSPKLGEIRQFIAAVTGKTMVEVDDEFAFKFAQLVGETSWAEAVDAMGGTSVIEVSGVVSYSKDRSKEYVNARYTRNDEKIAKILEAGDSFEPTVIEVAGI